MLTSLALVALLPPALASSHREAPAIAKDPAADITDLYAFRDPNNTNYLVVLMNVNPLEEPGGGPNFHGFDDNVVYTINIDNEGDGEADIIYNFRFHTNGYAFGGSFLYNLGDVSDTANLNSYQTYQVERIIDGASSNIATGRTVAPANVGEASAGSGYNPYGNTPGSITSAYTYNLSTGPGRGTSVFAGPRQEGFWVDLGATFDLLNNFAVTPTNTLYGKNVHTVGIRVPITQITRDGAAASTARQNEVVAIWGTTSRQTATVINGDGTFDHLGPFQQVARLGNPLVNEAVIGLQDKDKFNATEVTATSDYDFLDYVLNPTLIDYMNAILGVPVPDDADCDAGLGLGGREDLVLAFLTGHPALGTMPGGYALGGAIPGEAGKTFAAFEALRINLAGAGAGFWPDGRDIDDDVVDVALSAEAGLLCSTGGSGYIDDGVDSTGLNFLTTFPFLGDPWSGDAHDWPSR